MPDLKTKYLGLELSSPIVPSACPLSEDVENIKLMEKSGAGAVVLYSLFEEQIVKEGLAHAEHTEAGSESFAEASRYLQEPSVFRVGPEAYLEHIAKAKDAVDIPVIASLNGVTTGGWTEYAEKIEAAGADALELNIYRVPADIEVSGTAVEEAALKVVSAVRKQVKIPLAVKLSPYYSSPANFAKKLVDAGADGLVLFNRFYQPGIDLEKLEVRPDLLLSNRTNLRHPLRWIAILRGRVQADLAATSGVCTHEDVLKVLLAGADVAMMCSELMRRGVGRIRGVLDEVVQWMEEKEYESVSQMKGSLSQKSCEDPAAFERAQYIKTLKGYHLDVETVA